MVPYKNKTKKNPNVKAIERSYHVVAGRHVCVCVCTTRCEPPPQSAFIKQIRKQITDYNMYMGMLQGVPKKSNEAKNLNLK